MLAKRTTLKVQDAKRIDHNGKVFLGWYDTQGDMFACATYQDGAWTSCWIGNTHLWDIPVKLGG